MSERSELPELPELPEAPTRSLEIAPRPIRPRTRRPPLLAAAWVVALVAFAGIGLLAGGDPPTEPADAARELAGDPWPPDIGAARGRTDRLPSTYMGALLLRDAVALESPLARLEVTTRSVSVTGEVLVRAERVRVALEARGNRVLEQVSLDVHDPHGGIRPLFKPTFETAFALPFPRPNGTMWVVVTAYDARGFPLGSLRRPFEVGPLVQPGPWGPHGTGPRTAGVTFCLPQAPTAASSC